MNFIQKITDEKIMYEFLLKQSLKCEDGQVCILHLQHQVHVHIPSGLTLLSPYQFTAGQCLKFIKSD